ncbi:matrixin family metalloprotease [Giesbergeria sp.]|uniref:matrixin family metalloprotease n=1 Tax=Giesbergeria sp. TaxID=2818473 RepID=UPI002624B8C7|nr:matrixin family metalloprotease [Giesbergeria sp.]
MDWVFAPMAVTAADLETVVYSGDYRVDALLDFPAVWNFFPDGRNVLYYTFDASTGSTIDGETAQPVTRFNATQQQAARQILQYASSVTGIVFTEVNSSSFADVHFAATNLAGSTTAGKTSAYYHYNVDQNNVLTGLDPETLVYLDNVEHANINQQPVAGSAGYEVLLHEIGHMLGLGHPFDTTYPLPAAEDHTNNTVMSYTDRGGFKAQFQSYDLLALDWTYGRDGLGGNWGLHSLYGPTLSLGTEPVLQQGTPYNDTLFSRTTDEVFDGLQGLDTVVLQGLRADYTLSRQGADWQLQDHTAGRDGLDTLNNIERLQFLDTSVALDLDAAAGTAARLIGAVLGAAGLNRPDWVGVALDAVDAGLSAAQLNQLAWQLVLGPNASHTQIIAHLYQQLYHTAPDNSILQGLVAGLDAGQYTPADAVAWVAASDTNAHNINLVGLNTQGLAFVPV